MFRQRAEGCRRQKLLSIVAAKFSSLLKQSRLQVAGIFQSYNLDRRRSGHFLRSGTQMSATQLMIGARRVGELFAVDRRMEIIIWVLIASIYLFDVFTHPEDISACFAYTIPIFVSLFQVTPKPFYYAGATTILSLMGLLVEPSKELPAIAILGNRLIAIGTQWLAATLVLMQWHRQVDMHRAAEIQRRFVDILSHEIGTSLTTIIGQVYRLTKLSGQLVPNDLKSRTDKICNAAERIAAIVDRVQIASALGDEAIPIKRQAVNINEIAQTLIDNLKDEQHGRAIKSDLAPELPLVEGDEMLIRQALENIITNCVKYTPSAASIMLSTKKDNSCVRIAVVDEGDGISVYDLARVREPYYRGRSSKTTRGVGLGLYFVERVVEAHKGALCIESELGKGTKVIIDLPLARGTSPQ